MQIEVLEGLETRMVGHTVSDNHQQANYFSPILENNTENIEEAQLIAVTSNYDPFGNHFFTAGTVKFKKSIVLYDPTMEAQFDGFDWKKQAIWAYSQTDVEAYKHEDRVDFHRKLLADGRILDKQEAEVLFNIAIIAKDPDAIVKYGSDVYKRAVKQLRPSDSPGLLQLGLCEHVDHVGGLGSDLSERLFYALEKL